MSVTSDVVWRSPQIYTAQFSSTSRIYTPIYKQPIASTEPGQHSSRILRRCVLPWYASASWWRPPCDRSSRWKSPAEIRRKWRSCSRRRSARRLTTRSTTRSIRLPPVTWRSSNQGSGVASEQDSHGWVSGSSSERVGMRQKFQWIQLPIWLRSPTNYEFLLR